MEVVPRDPLEEHVTRVRLQADQEQRPLELG